MAVKNRIFELKIKKALEEGRDISNAELARRLKVSKQAVDQWVRQETNPYQHLESVCRYFEVQPGDVLYLDPPLEKVSAPEPQV